MLEEVETPAVGADFELSKRTEEITEEAAEAPAASDAEVAAGMSVMSAELSETKEAAGWSP